MAAHIIVPEKLIPYLEVEDCSSFNMERYYVTQNVRDILNNILRMKNIAEEIRAYGIDYINTTMLYGKTGTGKTTVARYIAHELGLDFAYINFAKIIDGSFGQTAKNICDVFEFISDTECVFMMDEIDCITVKRGTVSGENSGELTRITITVMQELDYLKKKNVKSVVLAATNRKDMIDEALLSRFAVLYQLEPLKIAETEQYINNFLNSAKIEYDKENIKEYCRRNSNLTQRNVESDINRCIAKWIEDGKHNYFLEHIKSL